MTPGQLRICTNCPYMFAYEFSVQGTNQLAPQIVPDVELAEWLRDGWTATYHDHAGPRPID